MIPDSLQTIAEISIGLAGFSGLIVALRKNTGPLTDVQKYRLQILFAMSFGAMFLSLLPDLLLNFGVPEDRVWFDASAVMFLYSLSFVSWMIYAARQVAKVAPEIFTWSVFSSITAAHIIVLLLLLTAMLGVAEIRAPGIFSLGLIWYLFHAAQQFVRMLFVLPRNPEHV